MDIVERDLRGIKVLDLKGKVTKGESEAALRDRIFDLQDDGHNRLIINLAGVPYIDSSGLGELVRCFTAIRKSGGRMGLTNLNPRLMDVLRITKLVDIFETYDSETDAASAFESVN